jgi:hypothetical protein
MAARYRDDQSVGALRAGRYGLKRDIDEVMRRDNTVGRAADQPRSGSSGFRYTGRAKPDIPRFESWIRHRLWERPLTGKNAVRAVPL